MLRKRRTEPEGMPERHLKNEMERLGMTAVERHRHSKQ